MNMNRTKIVVVSHGSPPPECIGRINEIALWLREFLRDGPRDFKEIKEKAKELGFARRSLHRAAERLGVIKERSGFGPQHRSVWFLPDLYAAMIPAQIRNSPSKYLSVTEVAQLLDTNSDVVLFWIKTGKLRAIRIGRRYYIDPNEIGEIDGSEG